MISPREARAIIRKAKRRVPHGEDVSHLNITPMLDMMTIIVVFLIKSVAVGNPPPSDLSLPHSETKETKANDAVTVTVTTSSIIVEGKALVQVRQGNVDAADKVGGADGIEISALFGRLEADSKRIRQIDQIQGINRGDEPLELTVIADRATPFRLLHEVMYTAGKAQFGRFNLVVLKPEGAE